jgi:hypothetical protein
LVCASDWFPGGGRDFLMADRFYDLIIVGYGPVGSVAANLAGH